MIDRTGFGRTGHVSSRVIFGAAALARSDQDTADEVLAIVDAAGINHIDTAAMYGDSELRLAPWLAGNRDRVFLATKTVERDGTLARTQLEASLERLGVDHVDLIQLHNLVEEDEWQQAHGPGGALEALIQAREEGLTRHIGVTGHGLRIPRMHLRSLERHEYDSVLFPYNHALLAIPEFRSDVEELIEICAGATSSDPDHKGGGPAALDPRRAPEEAELVRALGDPAAIGRAVGYVLSRPELFLLTTSDYTVLPAIIEAAAHPGPPPTEEQLEADTHDFEVSALFDGAALERI